MNHNEIMEFCYRLIKQISNLATSMTECTIPMEKHRFDTFTLENLLQRQQIQYKVTMLVVKPTLCPQS